MINKKFKLGSTALIATLMLTACGDDVDEDAINPVDPDDEVEMPEEVEETLEDSEEDTLGDQAIYHSNSGEIPDGLEEAADPMYAVGSTAAISANHLPGMDGATATIVGAYDTTAYSVTFTPTTGDDPIEGYKWVIHEELEDAQAEPYSQGDSVTLDVNHMVGVDNAEATIDSALETTVYMVDFIDTTTDEEIVNYKWLAESELMEE
ncbi:MAG: DUF1541 domain-containing protein [Bacillota bacterium]